MLSSLFTRRFLKQSHAAAASIPIATEFKPFGTRHRWQESSFGRMQQSEKKTLSNAEEEEFPTDLDIDESAGHEHSFDE